MRCLPDRGKQNQRTATRLTEHDKAALAAIERSGGYVMRDTSGLTQAGNAHPLTAGRFQRLVAHGRLVAAGDALFDGMPSQTYRLRAEAADSGWTDNRIAALKTLWAEGWSASQIAMRLGGVTRNAVIGKVHRLGLPARATRQRTPSRRVNQQGRQKNRVPTRGETPPFVTPPAVAFVPARPVSKAQEAAPTPLRIALLDILDGQCRWPLGDPKTADFAFCGCPTHPGSAYCNHHHRRAHK